MRRILFTLVVSGALFALAPASALARQHHKSHHRSAHHARIKRERWGSSDTQQQSSSSSSDQNAGTVAAPGFMNGVLTITLNDGTTVSGKVTDATQLECQAAEPTTMQTDEHGGDNSSGDHGDNGDEQGDGQQSCTTAALTTGTVVREAELSVSSAGAVWDKVELVTPQSTSSNPTGDGDDGGDSGD
jgi:hypothetical protein